jgi:hypothetical protein
MQHLLHRIANAQRLARGIGQRQRRSSADRCLSSSGSSRRMRWHSFAIGPAKGTIAMQRSRL